jgi:hypothetical protein
VEQRLVDAVRRACSGAGEDVVLLRHRVRNRAEKYRELARRARFDGAAAQVADVEARKRLFESLLDELDAAAGRAAGTGRADQGGR